MTIGVFCSPGVLGPREQAFRDKLREENFSSPIGVEEVSCKEEQPSAAPGGFSMKIQRILLAVIAFVVLAGAVVPAEAAYHHHHRRHHHHR